MVTMITLFLLGLLAGFVALVVLAFWRRGDHRRRWVFLLGWVVSGGILAGLLWVASEVDSRLLWGALIAQTGFLGAFLWDDIVNVTAGRRWLGRVWWALMVIWAMGVAGSVITEAPALLAQGTMWAGLSVAYGVLGVWLVVWLRRATMAELKNRAVMFLLMVGTLYITGLMLTSEALLLQMASAFVQLVLGGVLVYSHHHYRSLDVRVTSLALTELGLVTVGGGAFAWLILQIVAVLGASVTAEWWVLAVVAFLTSLGMVVIRQLVGLMFAPMRERLSVNLVALMREFNQQIVNASTLDEVVSATQKTLRNILGIERSALMLINNTFLKPYSSELIVLGEEQPQGDKHFLHAESPIFRSLAIERVPVGRYDLRYNPMYQRAHPDEHAFFDLLGMSVYIPIVSDNILLGILACGAREGSSAYRREDVQKLGIIGEQIGTALRSTRLIDDLQHLNESMRKLNQRLEDAKVELEKLDGVKTDFITIASHELRTPLAQIRGYTDIIDSLNEQDMLEQEQTARMVANLRKSSERMEELISAMLDVSQIDVNALDLNFVNATPESIVRLAIDPLLEVIKQRGLVLEREGLATLPPVEVDMQRMVQALRNVITNAIKYTPDGGSIRIWGRHEVAEPGDASDWVLLGIADTGIGIDPKHNHLIFQKFYRGFDTQLHSTGMYKFMGAGPGLGLTIARGILEGHGGRIWAESKGYDAEALHGTTFYIQIPTKLPKGMRGVLAIENEAMLSDGTRRTNEVRTTR